MKITALLYVATVMFCMTSCAQTNEKNPKQNQNQTTMETKSMNNKDEKVVKTDEEWKNQLTPEQYEEIYQSYSKELNSLDGNYLFQESKQKNTGEKKVSVMKFYYKVVILFYVCILNVYFIIEFHHRNFFLKVMVPKKKRDKH